MSATLYDEVAYPSHPFVQTHPLRLALPAALFGLPYAPAPTARVLEIGCGEGGNIVPMAVSYPKATIVGFDLASTAIGAGRRLVEQLGLTNIRLEVGDILEMGPDLGQFDYIIAHGVYSWVPDAVREGVLKLVKACLAPEGLAFISYNALPGCHLRMLIREMVLHHLRDVEGVEARLAGARSFLEFFIANAPDEEPTSATIKTYCRNMLARDPSVLFHDELGPVYSPFYLHEFNTQIAAHGLSFLGESEGRWWREELFPSSRGAAVAAFAGADPLEIHQYLDFLASRVFRQSIITHAERPVDRRMAPEHVRGLWVEGAIRPAEPDPDLDGPTQIRFNLANGAIALDEPRLKRALFTIGQAWPRAVEVAALADDPDLHEGLLQLFTAGHVEFNAGPPPGVAEAGERPIASPLARFQVSRGQSTLCGLDHNLVDFEDSQSRHLLSLLDGAHDRASLTEAMIQFGTAPEDAASIVATQLDGLAKLGMLVA